MTHELTELLQQALDKQAGAPLRMVDPRTQTAYVLVRAEDFERIRHAKPEIEGDFRDAPPALERSRTAFLRDLPELLSNPARRGWWAAYHGDQRLGMGKSPHHLLREIQRRGIPKDSYFLGVIRPHEPGAEVIEPRHGHHFDNCEPES